MWAETSRPTWRSHVCRATWSRPVWAALTTGEADRPVPARGVGAPIKQDPVALHVSVLRALGCRYRFSWSS
ncbi:hypothetical protein EDD27_0706 [Nonomuraea polychroma]|uniref:Uncharacterized protein n=1 Tax=Nonomuraea polychroma TaxID=46176 RepID=A0A438LY65_9ACTN|nr:hypothetical protein EDD27_0706 [Nonomuraea polychroma]